MQGSAYLFYFVANFLPRLMMFCLLLILTRAMPMDEYGRFVLVITTGELFDMACGGWVRIFALRSESAFGTLRPRKFGRILVLTVVTAAVSVSGAEAVSLLQTDHVMAFALAVAAYVLAFATLRLALTLLQIRRMHMTYAAIEMLRAGGTLVAASAATIVIGPSFVNASLAVAISTSIVAVVGLFYATRGVARPSRARTGYGTAFIFGLPIIAAALLSHSIGLVDRYIVDILMGPHAVAILAAAYAFARQPIDLFLGPLNTYSFPHLVKIYEEDGPGATGTAQSGLLITSTIVGGAIALGLTLLALPLLKLFLPLAYQHDGALIVPWLAVGSYFLMAKTFIFDNVFHLSKRTWNLPLAIVIPAVIGFVLCVVLIPRIGLVGAGIGYAVAAGLSCLVSALVASRIVRTPMPWAVLARVAVALLAASLALFAARGLLVSRGPLLELGGAGVAFSAVYAAVLAMFGISLRRVVETPWAPTGAPDARPDLAAALPGP